MIWFILKKERPFLTKSNLKFPKIRAATDPAQTNQATNNKNP
jgi:hypothetical protein